MARVCVGSVGAMKFFNLDLHISVIGDIQHFLELLGHQVTSWNLSGHGWVMGKERDKVAYVNHKTWRGLNADLCSKFYEHYRDTLAEFDAFICTYPPCFSLLYERFNKPIIAVCATRYEAPFCNRPQEWAGFNDFLRRQIDQGTLLPLANNKYDATYCRYFTNREWRVIPSYCAYTQAAYTGKRRQFLYASRYKPDLGIRNLVDQQAHFHFRKKYLRKGYRWQELADFKGIVHIPYNASVMSIFEQYAANIPLFFPSYPFLKQLREQFYTQGVLSELSFNQVWGYPPCSAIACDPATDPNRYDNNEVMMEWVKNADFYDAENMPYLQYFESFAHLEQLLNTVDLGQISSQMRAFNEGKHTNLLREWTAICQRVNATKRP